VPVDSATPAPVATEVKVTAAKGRPMLTWVGKRPLRHVKAFPAQHVETFAPSVDASASEPWSDWPSQYPQGGLLFHGDNKEVLAHLLAKGFRGKVNLIYIDPPFDSGADYVRRVSLRGAEGTVKVDGESYALGEQIQYTDIWANDNYLQFMFERLLLLRELLADDGSFYLHCDAHKSHHLRCLCDEVFGPDNFRNEITWQRFNFRADGKKFGTVHDTLLFYTRSADRYYFQKPYVSLKPSYVKSHFRPDDAGRLFRLDNLTAPSHGKTGKALRFGDRMIPPPPGSMWRLAQEGIDELWDDGKIVLGDDAGPQVVRYLDEIEGQAVHTIWTDVSSINSQSAERSNYPTQKPEALLQRIVAASSKPGDLVLDAFAGSGTTLAVAQLLGRRWIGCDINKGAIQTTARRLGGMINEQDASQADLGLDGAGPAPTQLAFTTWRVNDYDLQVQHNEAVNLAAEFLGLQRTRTDRYFDGTLGKTLAKIIPFGRPLTPLDLEELRRELEARQDEDRPITIVCLGMEVAAQAWVEEWNAKPRGASAINKIRVVELRTDPKYGGFLKHEPAKARVRVRRRADRIEVEIVDFISPSIVQRLQEQAGVLAPRVDDWRAMVDCVMIDPAFDGQVFNVALTDVPERKADYVTGRYELPAPAGKTTVAVKIIDMLGEEVVETVQV
jgi:adenine-specific DNA-methyltransferase